MTNIILHGANGKMGKTLQELIRKDASLNYLAGIDAFSSESSDGVKVYSSISECTEKADVIIDFSHFSAVNNLISYCTDTKTPVVVATTALREDEINLIEAASKTIPVFRTANMSLGINVIAKAMSAIVPGFEDDFDIEIVEKHHNQKLDAPSGTALLLADAINDSCKNKKEYTYGRYGDDAKRHENELGIHAIRGGTIPGEHSIIFAGFEEVIEIKHTALSRNIFAAGALKAAVFLATQKKGMYNMQDLLK